MFYMQRHMSHPERRGPGRPSSHKGQKELLNRFRLEHPISEDLTFDATRSSDQAIHDGSSRSVAVAVALDFPDVRPLVRDGLTHLQTFASSGEIQGSGCNRRFKPFSF
jgi:hypothetical protein